MTQGDPLSMFMYAIGTLPLIHSLNDFGQWTQLWYANDASASGTLPGIIGSISFVHMVLILATILNLQKVLLSSMNDGRVKLLQCSVIWEFRW